MEPARSTRENKRTASNSPGSRKHDLRFTLTTGSQQRDLVITVPKLAKQLRLSGWYRHRTDGLIEVYISGKRVLDYLPTLKQEIKNETELNVNVLPLERESPGNGFRKRRKLYIVEDANTRDRYKSLSIDTSARSFPALHTSGLLSQMNPDSLDSARNYWKKNRGTSIDPALHIAFENLSGHGDSRVVPQGQFRSIRKHLNSDTSLFDAYSDKSLYPILIPTSNQPRIYLYRINGRYYGTDRAPVHPEYSLRMEGVERAIIKPSRGDNGDRVALLERQDDDSLYVGGQQRTWSWIERNYGADFLIQEVVAQHDTLAKAHSSSLNTLRMVTLRSKGEIHYLLTFARFGAGGRINDNAGTGGICVGVQDDGTFNTRGINEEAITCFSHPTSGVKFSDLGKVPNFESAKEFVIALHRKLQYFDLISWDIAISSNGTPIFIECNFRGAIWIYQLASERPLFGHHTEHVLRSVKDNVRP